MQEDYEAGRAGYRSWFVDKARSRIYPDPDTVHDDPRGRVWAKYIALFSLDEGWTMTTIYHTVFVEAAGSVQPFIYTLLSRPVPNWRDSRPNQL